MPGAGLLSGLQEVMSMIDLLVKLLSPILIPMGVSTADLTSYLTMCKNYVYALLILIVVFAVVMIGCLLYTSGRIRI